MSTFVRRTKNPVTGKFEDATWLDDRFGRHRYGVLFPDGSLYSADLRDDWEFEDKPDPTPTPSSEPAQ